MMASRRWLGASPIALMALLLLFVASAAATDAAAGFDRSSMPIAKPLPVSSAAFPAASAASDAAERQVLAGLAESKRSEAVAVAEKEEEEEKQEGGKAQAFSSSSSSSASSTSSPSSPLSPLADSSPPVVPDAGAAESAALLDAIKEIEEEEAEAAEEANAAAAAAAAAEEEAEEAKAVASEPAPEARRAAAAAAAPSPSRSSSDFTLDFELDASSLTPEERERKEAAAADLSLARSRGDAAAAAVAFARLRDADAERDSDADEEDEKEEEEREREEGKEKKWRPFKMRDQSEEEEEEEERREAEKEASSSSPSSSSGSKKQPPQQQQQQQEQPHIAPPFDARWPSPAGVAFAALAGSPQSLSLSSALPPEYDAAVGGRGLPPLKNAVQLTSFAAARAAREAARRADRNGREPEDLMAAENERPRPRRETMLTAGLIGIAKANAYGAKPDDIPVVAATPLRVSEWRNAQGMPRPKDGKEASRLVIDRSSSSAPFELTFAANAAVDQPTRRFRPPDQSLCVGNGVVITGNNLVLRTWDAETGAPLQGPIAQPDFFGLDGNFSDPVCIYDSQDSKRFFVGVFRFGEGATKYSQFVLAASKTSNPADGFLGPYVFRNDGLDREGKPLPGLDDCGGDEGDEAVNKRGVSTEKKGSDGKKAAAAAAKKKNAADDDDGDKDDDKDDKSDRTEAAAAAPKKNSNSRKKISPGCLGDYPAVGLDTNAFVATFNLFQTEPEEKYAGVLLLAIDKKGLLSGGASQPAFVAYSNFNAEISYTVQPSQTQAGTPHDPSRGGTIYLASTGPCTQNEPNVNMVAAWAMTNTSSLGSPGFGVVRKSGDSPAAPSSSWTIPSISKAALVEVPAYRDPGAFKAERLAMPQPEPGVPLDSGDARTLQHVYSGGVLWLSAQTAAHVGSADAPLSVAVVYFALLPSWNDTAAVEEEGGTAAAAGGNSVMLSSKQQQHQTQALVPGALSNRHSAAFSPRLVAAGYFAAPGGGSLSRPAITAEPDGTAWVSALLTGPSTHPTQVAARADLVDGPSALHAAALSPVILGPTVPDKKFKGSSSSGNAGNGAGNKTGTLRAGDYAGATLDEQGNVWLAGMWSGGVPSASCVAKFTAAKCPSWGTLVSRIRGKTSAVAGSAAAATGTTAARASDRAALLGANGAVISARGVAGPSVPGARAGEWAAKAAKAKRAMEEREEREGRERRSGSATAAGLSSSASAPPSAADADVTPLVPSAVTYDPDDVPERVAGDSSSSSSGGR